jgi:hypothetical protein
MNKRPTIRPGGRNKTAGTPHDEVDRLPAIITMTSSDAGTESLKLVKGRVDTGAVDSVGACDIPAPEKNLLKIHRGYVFVVCMVQPGEAFIPWL